MATATATKHDVPMNGNVSTVAFLYLEGSPFSTVANRMQLVFNPENGKADMRSADRELANPIRIRPGDALEVEGHVFEVVVPRGTRPVFPLLSRI